NEVSVDESVKTKDEGREPSSFSLPPSSFYVADCTFESDLEMYFPETYVPGSQERMILYRELDSIENDQALEAYRQRLIDRFGSMPHAGEELLHVVPIRRISKRLGCEKITLRQGRMNLQFVSNPDSPYYQSDTFEKILNYMMQHVSRCTLREANGRRFMHISNVPTATEAVSVLNAIENT
ncbi:MAG: hypothetical protein IKN21_02270, partial [Prevotella sp.]|nr:hypothetical protein [Prevotella sp.]